VSNRFRRLKHISLSRAEKAMRRLVHPTKRRTDQVKSEARGDKPVDAIHQAAMAGNDSA
jgi:hypothetical protein